MPLTLNLAARQLQQQLSAAPSWEQRYRELLRFAQQVPALPTLRQPEHQVSGCQAQVWLQVSQTKQGLAVNVDSDSRLVKALLLVLVTPLQQASAHQLASFEFQQWLAQCRLADHLTESRVNGLHQIILALKQKAATFL